MANAKDKTKLTGDTHLPELEADDLDTQESHPEGTGTEGTQARERDANGLGDPGRGGRHAGELTDGDPSPER